MNKKGVFFLGFIGSEYDKHDLHQKSTSASACNDQKPDHWRMCYRTHLPDFEDIWKVNESSINIRSIGL